MFIQCDDGSYINSDFVILFNLLQVYESGHYGIIAVLEDEAKRIVSKGFLTMKEAQDDLDGLMEMVNSR